MSDFRASFEGRLFSAPYTVELGIRPRNCELDTCLLCLPYRADLADDAVRGAMQAGAVAALVDTAFGNAVFTRVPDGCSLVTLDLRIDHTRRPAAGRDVLCAAFCYRRGEKLAYVRGAVYDDDAEDPFATAIGVFMLIDGARSQSGLERPVSLAEAIQHDGQTHKAERLLQTLPFARFLDLRLEISDEHVSCIMPANGRLVGNRHVGALHGGATAGFLECAAILFLLWRGDLVQPPEMIDFSLDFVRSAKVMDTHAEPKFIRIGARVAHIHVAAWQTDPGSPVAMGRGTFLLTP